MASSTTPLSALSFATWNVRGLTSKSKRSSLAADCKRYNMQDANERGHKLNCKKDLEHLRAMAADKEL